MRAVAAFIDKLRRAARANDSLLCIGLDPDPERLPEGVTTADFNRAIIEATSDLVCAYKPNIAFYEQSGIDGLRALEATVAAVPAGIPVIVDAKRGDIGNTARAYAKALFETWGFDAATVSPYLGRRQPGAVLGLRREGRLRPVPHLEPRLVRPPVVAHDGAHARRRANAALSTRRAHGDRMERAG